MERIVVVSGYFNPLHVGHIEHMEEAAKLGDKLIVIVNNDEQVKAKGSYPFMNESDRARIVSSLKCVHQCVIATDKDGSVVKTLSELYSYYATDYFFDIMIFANGGDRRKNNSPEEAYCTWRKIKTVYNVGGSKTQSSSELISNWNKQNAEKEN
jgi:cytidyltransferase-like protein